ncbi:MAG TPA: hypothetical protein VL728_15405 [Cyclobacteriaceae bacterium]|jgi:hypothetical protein|nr:hypothetical protein [Cyclobacteriaceae bacterium]
MKIASRVARVFAAFFPSAYLVNFFYGDLFIFTRNYQLIFLIWAFPCLHLLITSIRLMIMLTGYQKYDSFNSIKNDPVEACWFLPSRVRFKIFFFSVNIGGQEIITSGLFRNEPSSILVYRNVSDKVKIITLAGVAKMIALILMNLIALSALKYIIYTLLGPK